MNCTCLARYSFIRIIPPHLFIFFVFRYYYKKYQDDGTKYLFIYIVVFKKNEKIRVHSRVHKYMVTCTIAYELVKQMKKTGFIK